MTEAETYDNVYTEGELVEMYTKYRPKYSNEVFDKIIAFCRETSKQDQLALDVACGSGQSTLPLANFFKQVIGLDVSKQQISHAPTNVPNVTFLHCKAEEMSDIQSSSVDLITVAMAFHWLTVDMFYAEVDRVLRPGGSLVVYSYKVIGFSFDDSEIDKYFKHIYQGILIPYFDQEAVRVYFSDYTVVAPPYNGWDRSEEIVMEKNWTLDQVLGFLNSLSGLHNFNKAHPDRNILKEAQETFTDLFSKIKRNQACDGESTVKVSIPIIMKMVHKPIEQSDVLS